MKIVVEIVLEPDPRIHEVRMLVRDSGVGFEPGQADHAFDPPSTADFVDLRALRERIRELGGDVAASSRGLSPEHWSWRCGCRSRMRRPS